MILKIQIERSYGEVQINILQPEFDSEIEDLADPKDELKKKIVNLASTIRKWNEETVKARKSVRDQLKAITDLGLNKYKMQKTELRKLTEEIFRYHGISESWLRRLLPEGLKDTSKTRLSYLQRQEIEKERQRLLLLQQQNIESNKESEIIERRHLDDLTMESTSDEPAELKLALSSSEVRQGLETGYTPSNKSLDREALSTPSKESVTIQKESEANKSIEKLKENVLWLSQPFVTKAYLQAADQDIPLVVQIDPVKKSIMSIRIDKDY